MLRFGRGVAPTRDHGLRVQHFQFERGLARRVVRVRLDEIERVLQVPDGFRVRRSLDRAQTCNAQISDSMSGQPSLFKVMRHPFGLCLHNLRELRLQGFGDVVVKLLTLAAQKAVIGRILDEGVLEDVRGIRQLAPDMNEVGRG